MKKYLMVLIILVFSAVGWAATKYVDPAATDDSGAGTVLDPYKTIQYACDNLGESGTVKLLAGTYDSTTQGAGWDITLDATNNGWDIVIEPNGSSQLTLTFNDTNYGIYMAGAAGHTTGDLTLRNLILTSNALNTASRGLVRVDDNGNSTTFDLTLDNVAILDGSGQYIGIYFADATNIGNYLTVITCTISITDDKPIYIAGAEGGSIDGLTITHTQTANLDSIALVGTVGSWDINDFTITRNGNATSTVACIELDEMTSNGNIKIQNGTINVLGAYVRGINIPVNAGIVQIYNVDVNNTVSADAGHGIAVGIDGSDNDNPYGLALIDNCRVIFNDDGGHAILTGCNYDTDGVLVPFGVCRISNCFASEGDYGIVIKDNYNTVIENCMAMGNTPYYFKGAKRCLLKNSVGYATSGQALLIAADTTPAPDIEPNNNTIENCILYAAGADYCFNLSGGNWISKLDRNCYYTERTNIAYIGAAKTTLAAIQSAWDGISDNLYSNDRNSTIADPQFVNAAGGDPNTTNMDLSLANGKYIGSVAPTDPNIVSGNIKRNVVIKVNGIEFTGTGNMTSGWLP
jgi:hypothetical protein